MFQTKTHLHPTTTLPHAPGSPAPGTLLELLRWRSEVSSRQTAFRFQNETGDESEITFAELDLRARRIATALQRHGAEGRPLLLIFPPGLDFVSAFLGCAYAGALAIPSTYPKSRRPSSRLQAIAEDSGANIVLTTSHTRQTLDTDRLPSILKRMTWLATDDLDIAVEQWQEPAVSPSDPAFLQYTSGSTSCPKGVVLTHGNVLENLEMIRRAFGLDFSVDSSIPAAGVSWLPPYHDMGLIGGILESIYVGGYTVLMSPTAFLKRPERWLQAISEHSASVSGAPNFAFDLCVRKITPQQKAKLDLSSWRVAFNGAEPVRAETLRRFTQTFGPCGFREEAFLPCYGLAEATLLVATGDWRRPPRTISVDRGQLLSTGVAETSDDETAAQELVSCGSPAASQKVRIVDPETGRRLPPGEVGEIWVSGPNVAQGYWNQPAQTAETFSQKYADNGTDGCYLRTGDLGFRRDDQLYITGRRKDLLIIRGQNYYPHDIEHSMQSAGDDLLPNSGAAFSLQAEEEAEELLVLVQEVDRSNSDLDLQRVIEDIRRVVAQEYDLSVHAVVLIRQASLPRTTSGKVQRLLCRQQFLDGELKELARWVRTDAHRNGNRAGPQPVSLVAAQSLRGRYNGNNLSQVIDDVETQLLEWLHLRGSVPSDQLDRHRPFAELGLDSLMAVEMSAELENATGVKLDSTTAWKYPTPASLAQYIAEEIRGSKPAPPETLAGAGEGDELESLLAELGNLTEEEAERAIERMQSPGPGDS